MGLRKSGPEDLNLHFHVPLLGGLYVADAAGVPRFRRARRWRQADIDPLIVRIAARCEAWLARRGFGTDEERDDDETDDALPLLQSASVAGWESDRSATVATLNPTNGVANGLVQRGFGAPAVRFDGASVPQR